MIKKHFLALLTHLFASAIGIIVFFRFDGLPAGWGFLFSLFMMGFYFYIGTRFSGEGTRSRDFFSFASIAIVGIVAWLVNALNTGAENSGGMGSIDLAELFYCFYNSSLLGGFSSEWTGAMTNVLFIAVSFVPVVIMWLGLEWKMKARYVR
ncbi:MAG: hypothetical protein GY754_13575 [bacterium]|nr:hypothetical protein [bacterium]